ncbi:MAG: hypothetical protein N3A59_00490 [Thermodesulfovibrionales bacterium]|nr:hypothetical protein [Thermodesulfovibrionales bacterium]
MIQEPIFIHIDVFKNSFMLFSDIFQTGVFIKTSNIGSNLYIFLKDDIGLTDEYIENKIKIVFLDNKPVDDLQSEIIKEFSKISLSAAMPGLVGAILRQNSPLYSMREGISKRACAFCSFKEGYIILKLFNLLINDLGPALLKKGVVLEKQTTVKLLAKFIQLKNLKNAIINGKAMKEKELLRIIEDISDDYLCLSVTLSS